MKNLTHLFLFTSLVIGSSASAQLIADPAADYIDATEVPEGWAYLRSTAASGGVETPLTAETEVGVFGHIGFGGNGTHGTFKAIPTLLGANTAEQEEFMTFAGGEPNEAEVGVDLLIHPGDGSGNFGDEYVIVRYTISAADAALNSFASIVGNFRNMNEGGGAANGVSAIIYHNTTELFNVDSQTTGDVDSLLTPEEGAFELSFDVVEGDTISFIAWGNSHVGADETALRAQIYMGNVPPPAAPAGDEITITQVPDSDELEISFPTVEGLSYNLRSSTSLSTDPVTWEIVEGQAGLDSSASPIVIPRPADPRTFYVIESFED